MTAYDVRISDWSSDVCSSDLASRMLRTDHPQSMRNYVRMFGLQPFWATFGDMEHSVRTGLPASDGVTSGFWAYRSEEHTSELQSLMRISYAVFCLKKKKNKPHDYQDTVLIMLK